MSKHPAEILSGLVAAALAALVGFDLISEAIAAWLIVGTGLVSGAVTAAVEWWRGRPA